jgi:hypothetical protein
MNSHKHFPLCLRSASEFIEESIALSETAWSFWLGDQTPGIGQMFDSESRTHVFIAADRLVHSEEMAN